jgi:tRNA pseudouridine38-40 synthase
LRYFLEISYKGTRYHGWQIQPNAITVQEVLNKALSTLLGEPVDTLGSGRTDTGVHAYVQVVHLDTEKEIKDSFLVSINAILPKDIAVHWIRAVHKDAHARFDALQRSYVYKIALQKNPFDQELVWFYRGQPNVYLMNQAAALLLRHTDFECFSKVHTEVNNFNCTITRAYWEQNGTRLHFHITANRFLRGMVRAIVGTLLEVGKGKCSIEDFEKILLSKDRNKAGMAAPPEGLYLCEVSYPETIFKS